MQYKEYILIYLTLISGLACTNTLHGIGIIIKRWKEISVDWVYFLASFLSFITIVDYWFHSFYFPYDPAETNILLFLLFLTPSSMLFFNTVILFPRWSNRHYNYTEFFQQNLRSNILIYGLFILSILLKIYVANFMWNTLSTPLFITLASCVGIYFANSIRMYKLLVILILIIHSIRWTYQGVIWV